MRTYVVADLHGRLDLLNKALELIEKHEPGRFICLGDFIDRGPHSKQIMDRFIAGPPTGWDWVVLQGNHEDIMLQALANPNKMRWWRMNGGNVTLKSFGIKPGNNPRWTTDKIPHIYRAYLQSLPVIVEDQHRIYVHAGVPFDATAASKSILQWMMYRDEGVIEYKDAFYADGQGIHISGKHIVHGHVQSDAHPLLREGRTNLDTWAYHTGRLAIGVFDDKVAGGPVDMMYVYGEPE